MLEYKGVDCFDSIIYHRSFNNRLRNRSRSFFNNTCVFCGELASTFGRKLCVHHIYYNPKRDLNEPGELSYVVPLCGCCHHITNSDREFWTWLYTWFINIKCGGKYLTTESESKFIKFVPLVDTLRGITSITDNAIIMQVPPWVQDMISVHRRLIIDRDYFIRMSEPSVGCNVVRRGQNIVQISI